MFPLVTFIIFLFLLITPLNVLSQVKIHTYKHGVFSGFRINSLDTNYLVIKNLSNDTHRVAKQDIEIIESLTTRITLKNRKVILGKYEKDDDSLYYIVEENGIYSKIKKQDVNNILLSDDYNSLAYSMFGITLFHPGGINFNVGIQNRNFLGIMASLGIFPFNSNILTGIQTNLLFNLSKKREMETSLSALIGFQKKSFKDKIVFDIIEYPNTEAFYYGIAWNINIKGIFFELGGITGNSNPKKFSIILQFGFVSRRVN